ncbi:MAG: acyl dehydratase [Betaproteobacteria bacterium]|nr:acyl dehydratase [Betaproteobacteria bacterium]
MTAHEILEHHDRAPAAVVFMARALLPSPGLPAGADLPRIVQRWTGLRIEPAHLAAFRELTGLGKEDGVSVLYPHVLGFRLQMALLTHRAYPVPIWNALQVRNRLVRHRQIDLRETLELETRTGPYRLVQKGIEIDLLSRLTRESECCWESEVTYFYRGRFGAAAADASTTPSPAFSEPAMVDRFQIPQGGGWGFGKLTGDYNGIHYWSWYARRLGFRTAFPHSQRVAGMCTARLNGPDSEAQTLELWIKGPLYYGAQVILKSAGIKNGVQFGLSLEGDHRPALLGQWQASSSQAP